VYFRVSNFDYTSICFVFEIGIRVLLGLLTALTLVASAESWSSSPES
jgi:hypothetical protein